MKTTMRAVECRECGTEFQSDRREAAFCKTDCLTAWRNRRAKRGAILYDLMMAKRYDRKHECEARSLADNFLRACHDGDKAQRSGRKSYREFNDAKAALPLAYGQGGDHR